MPSTYCPNGHRVSYDGVKPAKCPTCQTDMSPKSIATLISAPPTPAPRQPWSVNAAPAAQPEADDDFRWEGGAVTKIERASGMTVKDLAESGESVERSVASARTLEGGNKLVSVMDEVKAMISQASESPAPKRRPRAKRGSKGAAS